jgi:hypothetical protein
MWKQLGDVPRLLMGLKQMQKFELAFVHGLKPGHGQAQSHAFGPGLGHAPMPQSGFVQGLKLGSGQRLVLGP